MAKNIWGKSRKLDNPYAKIIVGDWEYLILKAYQTREKEKDNEFARFFCAVKSPMTYGSYDMGDTYVSDIPMTSELQRVLNDREQKEKE